MLARHIHYFLAVAEHLSFTKAAAELHVSQPALSQQVKLLEESLGAQLFDRSGRTTRLTDTERSTCNMPVARHRSCVKRRAPFMR